MSGVLEMRVMCLFRAYFFFFPDTCDCNSFPMDVLGAKSSGAFPEKGDLFGADAQVRGDIMV